PRPATRTAWRPLIRSMSEGGQSFIRAVLVACVLIDSLLRLLRGVAPWALSRNRRCYRCHCSRPSRLGAPNVRTKLGLEKAENQGLIARTVSRKAAAPDHQRPPPLTSRRASPWVSLDDGIPWAKPGSCRAAHLSKCCAGPPTLLPCFAMWRRRILRGTALPAALFGAASTI